MLVIIIIIANTNNIATSNTFPCSGSSVCPLGEQFALHCQEVMLSGYLMTIALYLPAKCHSSGVQIVKYANHSGVHLWDVPDC